jgi:hypothetical protein
LCEHISPHTIFREWGVGWAVDYINVALDNLVMNMKLTIFDMFHTLSFGKTTVNFQKLGAFVILVNFVAVNMVALCLNEIFRPEYLWEGIEDTYNRGSRPTSAQK